MRRLSRSVAVLFALLVTVEPVIARAQGAAPTDVRSQLPDAARKAWDAAKQLAGANDYKGALVEFQRAYDLSQNPRVLFNVGAGKLTPAETTELKNAIAIVQQFVTTIEVAANEPDATLFIDDYAVGKTPFIGPVRIDVGKHTLRL